MGRHRLWIGGLDVVTKAIRAVDLGGFLAVPERRGENLVVDGRNGAIYVGGKRYTGRRAEFEFQLFGRLPDGSVPADTRSQFQANLKLLGRVLSQDGLVPMVHQLPDETYREIPVEVAVALQPEVAKTGDFGTVGISFDSPSAFWRAQTTTTAAFSMTAGTTRGLAEFDASDAPVDDAVVTIGPSSNPRVTDDSSGTFLEYLDVIGAGSTLQVDCATMTLVGTGGLVPDRRKLRTHPRDGRWLALSPHVDGPPSLSFSQTGGAASVPLTVSGRQSWLWG